MKTKIALPVSIIILLMAFMSCSNKTKKIAPKDKEVTKNKVSITKEDAYNAGLDWTIDWADEFNRKTINTALWNFQVLEAGRFNEEWQEYTSSSDNAYIENNCLVIKTIHKSKVHGMDQYTSARLHTANKKFLKYGKIAARIKLPYSKGLWPAFWMLGTNINENGGDTPWPQCGEIDILELYGTKDDAAIEANAHYANASGSHEMMGAASYRLKNGKFADAFHVFEFEWDAHKMSWFIDGEQFASLSITEDALSEFHKAFFILLNVAVGGTHAGRPDKTTVFPQYMYVDWVRVYKKKQSLNKPL